MYRDPFGLCKDDEGSGFWNWVKNDLFNVETIKQSWDLTSGADYSTWGGWGEGTLGVVGGLANVVDAGFNLIPGKGEAEAGIKTAAKTLIKDLTEDTAKQVLNKSIKQAQKEFRTNKKFKDWVHREFKKRIRGTGGKTNRDLTEQEMAEALEEFNGL